MPVPDPLPPRVPGGTRGSRSGRQARAAAARRRRSLVTLVAGCLGACVLGVAAWAAAAGPRLPARSGAAGRAPEAGTDPDPSPSPLTLQVTPAPYQLPAAISREVVLPTGSGGQRGLLIVGGLTPSSTSSDAVTRLDPVTGATSPAGRLAAATHDAAGAILDGRPYVFGGGAATSVPTVQEVTTGHVGTVAGRLPTARSDVSAVTVGDTAYLVGGHDGSRYGPDVLATQDGRHFRTAAKLPVPVRYAGVAALGGRIWVFGGETPSGPTDAIQRIDLATGRATVAGHLPHPVQGASAVTLDGRIYLAGGQVPAGAGGPGGASPAGSAGSAAGLAASRAVLNVNPATATASSAGQLPVAVGYAGAAVVRSGTVDTAYLVGGENGQGAVPTVTTLRLVPTAQAVTPTSAASAPWLAPAAGGGHPAPGSNPAVLPSDVLIADHGNNRLLIVDPQGRIRWTFPHRGCLARGQTFLQPDDAFFSPNGRYIIATQEDDYVISVIDVATCRIVYRYGTPGVPGSGPNHLDNPDDAMLTPTGTIVAADIKNCRIITIDPPAHRLQRVIGQTTHACVHNPPRRFGSPNGAFPMTNGNYLITEINSDWADSMSLTGQVAWSTNPPGVAYPSDTNEVYPGRYLTADYSDPGQVVEFDSHGRLLWRMGGLNKPSLALPLPNGDILLNDDYNHRVIVVDPRTNRVVWQYGHTGVSGTAPGYLNDPDGVDLVPPDSLLVTHAATMGQP